MQVRHRRQPLLRPFPRRHHHQPATEHQPRRRQRNQRRRRRQRRPVHPPHRKNRRKGRRREIPRTANPLDDRHGQQILRNLPKTQPARAGKIIALARLHHEHRQPFAATLRERYGISANQIGKTITYGEAWDLVYQLLDDPSNPLCAEIAQWSYPARLIDLLQLAATIGDGKAAEKIMPWTMARRQKQIDAAKATPEEIDKALAELDEEIIITNVETT